MPGFAFLESVRTLEALLCIMHLNSAELLQWLGRTDEPKTLLAVWDDANPAAFEGHLDEAERLLFNYLAAVHARVNYYQGLKNRGYIDGSLLTEYEARVDLEFRNDGRHHWMIGLRNYMMHHKLPRWYGNLRFEQTDQIESRMVIATAELLTAHEFNATARLWMQDHPEVDLRVTVRDYSASAGTLDRWFMAAYSAHHKQDTDAFLQARAHVIARDSIDRLGSPGPC
jgi:hypothetical protein